MGTALAAGLAFTTIQAQIPGRNVNMVSGTTYPFGDPFLQRQNEPSIAASTRNPLHLLAGANDYRTVDLPGLPDDEETGDAWLGLFKSMDGGDRWRSGLLPGFPQDSLCDPIKNLNPDPAKCGLFGYQAGADPVVRAGTHGLLYYAGLVFDRGDAPKSAVFVARFIDNNNRESGDPIAHIGTSIVASQPGTVFALGTGKDKGKKFTLPTNVHLDKPWMAVDIPRPGTGTCTITTQGVDGPVTQTVPAGMVYVAYSVFSGEGPTERSDIMFTRSANCGKTWSAPVTLSNKKDIFNQGATIAIDPVTGSVYVAWRRFSVTNSGDDTDALLVSRSLDLGKKFSVPGKGHKFKAKKIGKIAYHLKRIMEHRKPKKPRVATDLTQEFDQATTPLNPVTPIGSLSFRTNAYPTLAFDGQSRLYMAWSERGFGAARPDPEDGDARIVISTSKNGEDWTAAKAIAEAGQPGHQIMPSMTFAGGKLLVVYYDLREDRTQVYGPHIDDGSAIVATMPNPRRHTIDIRTSMGKPGTVPVFDPSVRVSEYLMGYKAGENVLSPQQANPPNLPNFQLGTVPFMGDYIDVAAAPAFVPIGKGQWRFNTDAGNTPVFHTVWTDNRDVKPPKPGTTWADYTPIGISGPSLFDPSKQTETCDAGNEGMRNQNIYTSRITGGLQVGSPGNTKPLSTGLQRGFVVFARNATDVTLSFRMRVLNQPVGGRASFNQSTLGSPITQIDVTTPPRSMASRTVFVTSTDPEARVDVEVTQIAAPGGAVVPGGLKGSVSLNADIENPGIEADIENADIENQEVHSADIENADIENADIENADIENADIENNLIPNADIENADIENADIENADIENADIENADIENGAPADTVKGVITDVTWTMTNEGNTTTAYNVNLFLNEANVPLGIRKQLVLRKIYKTPAGANCTLKEKASNVLIANILDPEFLDFGAPLPDPNDPSAQNGTLWLNPGETGQITLRIIDPDKSNNVLVDGVSIDPAILPATPVVQSQSGNTGPGAPPDEVAVPVQVTTFSLPGATAGLPYLQTLGTAGGTGTARTWSVVDGSLPAGLTLNTQTGAFVGTVDPAARGLFKFTVQVGDEHVPADVDSQPLEITVSAGADLSIAKVDNPDPAVAGNDLTYTITVSNAGPSTATSVVITDALPGSASFISASASCAQAAGQVQCDVGTLSPGGSAVVTVVVRPTAPGTLVNTATATASEADPTSPNVATASTMVNAIADLAITMTDAPDPVSSGNNITYSLTVTNLGPSTANGVTVTDTLPAGVTFSSATTPFCSHNAGTVTCSLGVLARNALIPLSIVVTTSSPGTVVNAAIAAAVESDLSPGNNTATTSTTVLPPLEIVLPSEAARTARQGVGYALPLQVSGGTAPYTWSIVAGLPPNTNPLPAGLSLNANTGVIGGTPTTFGPRTFTVRVEDFLGQVDTQEMCIRVGDQGGTVIVTETLNPDGGLTIETLVSRLLGPSVTAIAETLRITGNRFGAGTFTGASAVLGFEEGIVLSSGSVAAAPGPNESENQSTNLGVAGDFDLDEMIYPRTTLDATVLEFDFRPSSSKIAFRYVFGSDEYNEFSNSLFDDVFGFFITQMTEDGLEVVRPAVNCAVVPNTALAVSINTINLTENAGYFRDNTSRPAPIGAQADGLTVVMACEANVIPNEKYHLKLAIADATDQIYDSWVFIEGSSFGLVEICNNGVDDDRDGSIDALDADCQVCHADAEEPIDPEPLVIEVPGTAGGQVNFNDAQSGGPPVQAMLLGPNEQVSVTATGVVSFGGEPNVTPEGCCDPTDIKFKFLAPLLPAMSLIARIGGGPWQFVGVGPTILQAGGDGGYLEFAMNDNWFDDNYGPPWTVTIQRLDPPQ